jgi:hypothetical protein
VLALKVDASYSTLFIRRLTLFKCLDASSLRKSSD